MNSNLNDNTVTAPYPDLMNGSIIHTTLIRTKRELTPGFTPNSSLNLTLNTTLLFVVVIICLWLTLPQTGHTNPLSDNDQRLSQRKSYQTAMKQLAAGKLKAFNNSAKSLESYPLYPYLEYASVKHALNRKSKHLPTQEVHAFLDKYSGTPVADKLSHRWLNLLIKKKQWQQYADDWNPNIRNTRLQCWNLRANYRIGNKQAALNAVEPLWLSATSQPKGCNPLFKEWIEEGYLSQDVAWQRLTMAMNARQTSLAQYVVNKLLNSEHYVLGTQYLKVHRSPKSVGQQGQILKFPKHEEKSRQIVVHGIKRLAKKDLINAKKYWQNYRNVLPFTEQQIKKVNESLSIAASYISNTNKVNALPNGNDKDNVHHETPKVTESRIRTALRNTDWNKVNHWISLLPEELKNSYRWRYWQARSMKELGIEHNEYFSPKTIYNDLAKTRSFYGFLAADIINADYAMEDKPAPTSAATMQKLNNNSAIIRALELFSVNQLNDARREWRFGSRNFDTPLLTSAGKLAEEFGWHEKAIKAYIKAQYWNDVQTRFPLAYKHNILQASDTHNIDANWIYAIARQESAFSPDAKSKAGALGLMQLMPRTARQNAKQIGLKFRRSDLLQPDTNIHLGSNYLKVLLKKFNGNRILATTAYNA